MVGLVYYLQQIYYFLTFRLLCYYVNLSSSIIFCLSSGEIYLYLGISLSCSFLIVSGLFCDEVLEVFVTLSAISLLIKPSVASTVSWITLFEVVLSASVADWLAWTRIIWLYLTLTFFVIFLPIFLPIFLEKK